MRTGSSPGSVPEGAHAELHRQCKGWPQLRRGCRWSWGGGSARQVGPPRPKAITMRGHTAKQAPSLTLRVPPPQPHAGATARSNKQRPSSRRTSLRGQTVGASSRTGVQQEIPVAPCARKFGRAVPTPAKPVGVAGDRNGVHVQLTSSQSPCIPPQLSGRPLRGEL